MPDFKLKFEVFLGFENDEFLRECQQSRKVRVFVGVAIKIIASYTEDQIVTSDPSQLLNIKKAKEELKMAQGV